MAFMSLSDNNSTDGAINNAQVVNTAIGVYTAGTQVNTANIDNLNDAVIYAFLASQPNSPELVNEDLEQIHPDNLEEMDLRWQMAMLTMRARRECRAPRSQDTKHKERTRRIMPVKTPTSTALNEQLLKDLKKSDLIVLGYKSGIESVEERFRFFKTNESVYIEDIKLLKVEIKMKDIAIKELRRKLEVAQKEKNGIQLTVKKLKNASKSLNKLIDCQIVDNCKKGLGYESYNGVLPLYTGNFMPQKPDLSYIGLDEFADKPVVENYDAKTSETKPKDVRKNNDAPVIEEWVSDDEEEKVAQPKIEQKQGNTQMDLHDKGVIDSRCSRHITRNMSYLTNYEEIDEGYVAFGGNIKGDKITGKCTIRIEAVNTACYVQNRVLVVKPNNKTPYELFHGRTPALSFMKPFGCPVTIHNTLDHLGKFDGKPDEGFFVEYSINSKSFRVFNSRKRTVEENLHIRFSENTPNVVGSGPDWLFDIDALTKTINYELIATGTQSNGFAGTKACDNTGQARKETNDHGKKADDDLSKGSECRNQKHDDNVNSTNNVNAASTNGVNAVSENISNELPFNSNIHALKDISTFNFLSDHEDDAEETDMNNMDTTIQVNHVPTTRIHKDHPLDQVIGDLHSTTQTRNMSKNLEENGFVSTIHQRANHKDLQNCLFTCFLSQEEPKKAIRALKDPSWIEAMQEELLQFKLQEV
nr:putative ribonuclease H-like domain-containing protein [Tanacetum cinerariifolium]